MIKIEEIQNSEFNFLLDLGFNKHSKYELTELAAKELYKQLGEKLKISPKGETERSHIIQLDEVRDSKKYSIDEIIKIINNLPICIDIDKFFDKNGKHITKKEYGIILINQLCGELKDKY